MGFLSELGKLLISDLNLDACKWRMMRGCSGFHFGNLRVFGERGHEVEDVSVPSSWGLLVEELTLFTCVSLRSWPAVLEKHREVGASVAQGEPAQESASTRPFPRAWC